ncbi:hypothetical protein FR5810_02656 [Bordetella pertussis]|nr:hypothetical protein FR5810_02656 [Bordetella pertussis]
MDISSHLLAELANGVCLETRVDGQTIGTYVVLGPADLDAIADIVPRQRVEEGPTFTRRRSTASTGRKWRSIRSSRI